MSASEYLSPDQFGSKDEAHDYARGLLAQHGHPRADDLVMMAGNVGHSSAIHWQGTPSLMLNGNHLNQHVVAHEVTHLLLQHRTGQEESGHGEDFHRLYRHITGVEHGSYVDPHTGR